MASCGCYLNGKGEGRVVHKVEYQKPPQHKQTGVESTRPTSAQVPKYVEQLATVRRHITDARNEIYIEV
jgi:hypothetical protein